MFDLRLACPVIVQWWRSCLSKDLHLLCWLSGNFTWSHLVSLFPFNFNWSPENEFSRSLIRHPHDEENFRVCEHCDLGQGFLNWLSSEMNLEGILEILFVSGVMKFKDIFYSLWGQLHCCLGFRPNPFFRISTNTPGRFLPQNTEKDLRQPCKTTSGIRQGCQLTSHSKQNCQQWLDWAGIADTAIGIYRLWI